MSRTIAHLTADELLELLTELELAKDQAERRLAELMAADLLERLPESRHASI